MTASRTARWMGISRLRRWTGADTHSLSSREMLFTSTNVRSCGHSYPRKREGQASARPPSRANRSTLRIRPRPEPRGWRCSRGHLAALLSSRASTGQSLRSLRRSPPQRCRRSGQRRSVFSTTTLCCTHNRPTRIRCGKVHCFKGGHRGLLNAGFFLFVDTVGELAIMRAFSVACLAAVAALGFVLLRSLEYDRFASWVFAVGMLLATRYSGDGVVGDSWSWVPSPSCLASLPRRRSVGRSTIVLEVGTPPIACVSRLVPHGRRAYRRALRVPARRDGLLARRAAGCYSLRQGARGLRRSFFRPLSLAAPRVLRHA